MKYRLLTNCEGKWQAQFNDVPLFFWVFGGWEYITNESKGRYELNFDNMEDAIEAISNHKASVAATVWTAVNLPDQ